MKTRAALFRAVGQPFEVVEVDLREPGPDEVVVAMTAVGICGTDLHQVKGEFQRPTPMVLGHEGAGVVEEVGSSVSGLAPGDEVVLSWAPSCGVCGDCRRGRPAACVPLHQAIGAGTLVDGTTGISFEGETVYRGTATGALAERVVVASKAALPTGGAIPLREAALLGCAALTGVGSVLFAARVSAGSSVLVLGGGGVGQFLVQGARIAGAATIVCADPVEARRAQALELGATHAFDPAELETELATIAPEGVDYAFDAVGDPGRERRRARAHAQRRDDGDRRPAGDRLAARPRPGPAHPPREVAHRDDVRLRGSGGRAAGADRPRPRGPARPRLARRAVATRWTT